MVKDHCYSHEHHQETIRYLIQACEQNTRVSADNATTLKLFIKLVGGSLVILVTIISVILPLMYHDAQRINGQIVNTLSGVSQNKSNIQRIDETVHEHDLRLRDGGL